MDHGGKIKDTEKRDKYWDLAREKNVIGNESDGNTNYSCCAPDGPQRIGRKTWGIMNQRKNRDHPDNSIVWDWPGYWEESWIPEENGCHSDSRERSPANDGSRSQVIMNDFHSYMVSSIHIQYK